MVLEGIRAGFGVWTHGMNDDNRELKKSGKTREKCDEVWRHHVAEVSANPIFLMGFLVMYYHVLNLNNKIIKYFRIVIFDAR